jgi:spore maturation protein CgeB
MSYRFVKVASFYRDFLRQYYEKYPGLVTQSYGQQYSHLMDQAYSWSDFYARHLCTLGAEAFEIVSNAQHLQRAWAAEHGSTAMGRDLVLAQLKALKPEVVFFQDSISFNGEWVRSLYKEIPSLRLTIGWCCAPYGAEHLEQFSAFDIMCVCGPNFMDEFSRNGFRSFEIHHAFEDSLVPRLAEENPYPSSDFIFIGSLIPGAGYHDVRKVLLEYLLNSEISLELYANIPRITEFELLQRQAAYVAVSALKKAGLKRLASELPGIKKAYALPEMPRRWRHNEKLEACAKPPLFGLEMFKALSRAKIGFNNHGDVAGEYAANVRLFEVTGAGACLLTDRKKNLGEFFEEDKEAVAYGSPEECIEKVRYLTSHPEICRTIAAAGQARTLRDHSFRNRAEELHQIIVDELRRQR